jgi:hypothetical protein
MGSLGKRNDISWKPSEIERNRDLPGPHRHDHRGTLQRARRAQGLSQQGLDGTHRWHIRSRLEHAGDRNRLMSIDSCHSVGGRTNDVNIIRTETSFLDRQTHERDQDNPQRTDQDNR